jgi:hypothetical protein
MGIFHLVSLRSCRQHPPSSCPSVLQGLAIIGSEAKTSSFSVAAISGVTPFDPRSGLHLTDILPGENLCGWRTGIVWWEGSVTSLMFVCLPLTTLRTNNNAVNAKIGT